MTPIDIGPHSGPAHGRHASAKCRRRISSRFGGDSSQTKKTELFYIYRFTRICFIPEFCMRSFCLYVYVWALWYI